MRAMLAGCLMAAFFVFTASAQEQPCLPFEYIKGVLDEQAGMSVFLGETDIARAYLSALKVDLPEGSDPIAIYFTTIQGHIMASLIEPEYCVRYSLLVPAEKHVIAWDMATRGI